MVTAGKNNGFASIQFQALNNNRKQTHSIETKPRVKSNQIKSHFIVFSTPNTLQIVVWLGSFCATHNHPLRTRVRSRL